MQDKLINDIKVTMAAEGLFITKQDERLISDYYNGNITEEEGINIIKTIKEPKIICLTKNGLVS